MKNIKEVIQRYKENSDFKRAFDKVVFSHLNEEYPDSNKNEKLKAFISDKNKLGFTIKAATLLDKIDYENLSDEMIDMDLNEISAKFRGACEKLDSKNEVKETLKLNPKIVRGASVEECENDVRLQMKAALEESQSELAKRVKQEFGADANYNDYQINKDRFERYNTGRRSTSRGFEAENFGNVDEVADEFRDRMEASRRQKSGYSHNYENGINYAPEMDISSFQELRNNRSDIAAFDSSQENNFDMGEAEKILASRKRQGEQNFNSLPKQTNRGMGMRYDNK